MAVRRAPIIIRVTKIPTMTNKSGIRDCSDSAASLIGNQDASFFVKRVLPPRKTGELSPLAFDALMEIM